MVNLILQYMYKHFNPTDQPYKVPMLQGVGGSPGDVGEAKEGLENELWRR